jgi:hypothetical protein
MDEMTIAEKIQFSRSVVLCGYRPKDIPFSPFSFRHRPEGGPDTTKRCRRCGCDL